MSLLRAVREVVEGVRAGIGWAPPVDVKLVVRQLCTDASDVIGWARYALSIQRALSRAHRRASRSGLLLGLLLTLAASSSVRADDVCSSTWPERLATARAVVATRAELMKLGRTGFAAAQFYFAHCRDMSRLERAVRHADDVNAFVCEPEAGRVPPQLTPRFTRDWLSHFGQFPDPDATPASWLREAIAGVEITGAEDAELQNAQCASDDVAAGRIALTLDAPTPIERLLAEQSVLVWGCSKPSCNAARAQLDAARAKLAK